MSTKNGLPRGSRHTPPGAAPRPRPWPRMSEPSIAALESPISPSARGTRKISTVAHDLADVDATFRAGRRCCGSPIPKEPIELVQHAVRNVVGRVFVPAPKLRSSTSASEATTLRRDRPRARQNLTSYNDRPRTRVSVSPCRKTYSSLGPRISVQRLEQGDHLCGDPLRIAAAQNVQPDRVGTIGRIEHPRRARAGWPGWSTPRLLARSAFGSIRTTP